jgi:hypothetical protein
MFILDYQPPAIMGLEYLDEVGFFFLERFIVISLNGHLVYSFDSTDILRKTFSDLFRTTWLSSMSSSGGSGRSSSTCFFTL